MTPVQAKSILLRLCANYPALVLGSFPLCPAECQEVADWLRQELWNDNDAKNTAANGTPWCTNCEDFHPACDPCQSTQSAQSLQPDMYPSRDNCLCHPCICANDLKNRYEKFPWLNE